MMETATKIQSFSPIVPTIYAYTTPGITYHEGWTKIGYTEKQPIFQRFKGQRHAADVQYQLAWQDHAMYQDGSGQYFTGRDFHTFLESQLGVERAPGTEWFHIDGPTSREHFNVFSRRETAVERNETCTYTLRKEQQEAVAMTKAYFRRGGEEFLWNAKPRFGKTLASYDLVQQMGATKVLIVTNRPSIANSWADDFLKFVGWRGVFSFVSDTDALKDKPGVLSREEFLLTMRQPGRELPKSLIAFESLQGLKGSLYFGGQYDKLRWIRELEFDLLIVDEAQEGVDTIKTERAFQNIKRSHTLYLSGTPFKQLASAQFSKEQIFNWSYADEQEAKEHWSGEDGNPYETLPRLAMFTYQLSGMLRGRMERGLDLSGEDGAVGFAFDLNEFFATNEGGKFIYEEEVRKFLHALTTQEKYPFSTPELRQELAHTMWYLNRVASARALEKLLQKDEVFKEYKVVVAAGDGRSQDDEQVANAFEQVKAAIANYSKTITITVGQLTVGVTIPEWSGVLMLCNMKSPSSYMQAAFRAQNACVMTKDGQRFRKETAYVFDFDPARTLTIFDEFANNLSADTMGGRGTSDDRKDNIRRLLNFFPVLGEDDEGKMVELDAASVLSIPRRLKSQEVVHRGFMSNFLFQNISNIFGAPSVIREIVKKLTPAHEEGKKPNLQKLDGMDAVTVDENGEVALSKETVIGKARDLFGPKLYEEIAEDVYAQANAVAEDTSAAAVGQNIKALAGTMKAHIKEKILPPVVEDYGLKKGALNRLEQQVERDIDQAFQKIQDSYEQQTRVAQAELERKQKLAGTEQEVQAAKQEYQSTMDQSLQALTETVQKTVQQTIEEKPKEVVEQLERRKAEQEKQSVEDEVRSHLRGFSRTIPSFIMAYGDGNLTLANFDVYTEKDVFLEVTGITEEEFRFLRDGGDYLDAETGSTRHFEGRLFDEVVFNDSVEAFWKKKQQLADYFDESQDEDIFDYIPPQKTNQIFTPRWVVSMMVDQLEENNPGCFDDPSRTFADLYMKSGLYITEVVKRLYRSEGLKTAFPDEKKRIRHILQNQVFGMAPTRIIYLIATSYILGFDHELKDGTHNFVQANAAEAAKHGTLGELVNRYFGERTRGCEALST